MKIPSSPYIKLFQNKGINWHFAITQELIDKTKKEGKLFFIHIGYIGSILNRDYMNNLFSDEETIEILNNNFISVIVDKEEKPETFLLGLDLLKLEHNFSYGPINIFALPDRKPIISFSNITSEEFYSIAENLTIANENKRTQLERLAFELSETITETGTVAQKINSNNITKEALFQYFEIWKETDFKTFIFNHLKPFTPDPLFIYLLEFASENNDAYFDNLISNYLNHLQFSSIYDPIDGGLFRQSTDFSCTKPLFEKTLIENAHFLKFYALAAKQYKKESYSFTAYQIFDFIKNELTSEESGLYSSSTLLTPLKDSHYYFYTIKELEYIFPHKYSEVATSLGFNQYLDAHIKQLPIKGVESCANLSDGELYALKLRRKEHTGYFIDTRIIIAYNCDAIDSIAQASKLLNNKEMFEFAKNKMDFIRYQVFNIDKIEYRCVCGKQKSESASLSDYAYYIQSLLTFYEITGEDIYLEDAVRLSDTSIIKFYKAENGMFSKSAEDEMIFPFKRESNTDNIKPSVNSIMTGNLIKLYSFTGDKHYFDIAECQINNIVPVMLSSGQMLLSWGYQLMKILLAKKIIS